MKLLILLFGYYGIGILSLRAWRSNMCREGNYTLEVDTTEGVVLFIMLQIWPIIIFYWFMGQFMKFLFKS